MSKFSLSIITSCLLLSNIAVASEQLLYLKAPEDSQVVGWPKSLVAKFSSHGPLPDFSDDPSDAGGTLENPFLLDPELYPGVSGRTLGDVLNLLRSEDEFSKVKDIAPALELCEKLGLADTLTKKTSRICSVLGKVPIKTLKLLQDIQEELGDIISIPGGVYTIGSPLGEPNRLEDEIEHLVELPDYQIGKAPITQIVWIKKMGEQGGRMAPNPSTFKRREHCDDPVTDFEDYTNSEGNPDSVCKTNPVEGVSWNKIRGVGERGLDETGKPAFLTVINMQYSKVAEFDLPSEAMYEVAMRGTLPGGQRTAYVAGETPTAVELGRFVLFDANSQNRTHSVVSKPGQPFYVESNAFGFRRGAVWEWVKDVYNEHYLIGPLVALYRIIRGCSWNRIALSCRSAFREMEAPGNSGCNVGFRVRLVRIK